MERIVIWDMDWFEKNSFVPKPTAMKVASYHKQIGDIVHFIHEANDLNYEYDIIYVFREKKNTGFPPLKILDSPKTLLCGGEFIYYDTYWEPDAKIAMTRPSYTLYPLSDENIYKGAHIIQLLYKKTFLLNKQDYTNFIEQPKKKSLVVDEHLWEADTDTIVAALTELQKMKNVEFKHPISLNRIMNSKHIRELFLSLHFIGGTNMPFVNDWEMGHYYAPATRLIDFLKEFRKEHKVALKPLKFKSNMLDHWDIRDAGWEDFERCLKIVAYAKRQKIQVEIMAPEKRSETPYWAFFDILEIWTRYNPYISYIQAMLGSTVKRAKLEWHQILNDSKKWSTPRVWFLLHVWMKDPELIMNEGAVVWEDKRLDLSLVNLNEILKSVNKGEREEMDIILRQVQENITNGEW